MTLPRSSVARLVAVLTALVLVGSAVVACESAPPQAPSPAPPSRAPVTDGPPVDGVYPVTLRHAYGETVVPAAPKRVLATGDADEDTALALDVIPIGMARVRNSSYGTYELITPWTARRLDDVRRRLHPAYEPVQVGYPPGGGGAPYDLLSPDLILAVDTYTQREGYDAATTIAPTVGPLVAGPQAPQSWQDVTRVVARALGKPVEAERLITTVEARIAAAPSRYPQLAGKTGACVSIDTGKGSSYGLGVDGPGGACSRLLAWLGMRRVPALDVPSSSPYPFTSADIVKARPDVVVLANSGGVRDSVRMGFPPSLHVVDLDDDEATAIGSPSVLSLPSVLDTFPPKVVRAVR